jgi:hypothetical protein
MKSNYQGKVTACEYQLDNYELSCNRLRSMHFKLHKKPELLNEYDQIIKEQLSSGITEKVPEKEIKDREHKDVHYIPHHMQLHDKTQRQLSYVSHMMVRPNPLGVLSPFTIVLKCLLQSMCVKGMDWYEELQEPY